MAGPVPAIHAFNLRKDVDARHKAGHDEQSIIWPVLRTGRSAAEGRNAVPQKGNPLTRGATLACHPRAGGDP